MGEHLHLLEKDSMMISLANKSEKEYPLDGFLEPSEKETFMDAF